MSRLIDEVEAFLAHTGMAPTRFGVEALADRHLVRTLREGRRTFGETDEKVRAFMETHGWRAVCSVGGCDRRFDDPAAQGCTVVSCPFAVKEAA